MQQQDLFTDLPARRAAGGASEVEADSPPVQVRQSIRSRPEGCAKVVDDHQGQRACFVSQETIAEETGYGLSTVRLRCCRIGRPGLDHPGPTQSLVTESPSNQLDRTCPTGEPHK